MILDSNPTFVHTVSSFVHYENLCHLRVNQRNNSGFQRNLPTFCICSFKVPHQSPWDDSRTIVNFVKLAQFPMSKIVKFNEIDVPTNPSLRFNSVYWSEQFLWSWVTWRWLLTSSFVSPSTFMSSRICFGVATAQVVRSTFYQIREELCALWSSDAFNNPRWKGTIVKYGYTL